MTTINPDVYGSLAHKHLGSLIDQRTEAFGALWCEKAEGLMNQLNDSVVCALRAFRECMRIYHVEMTLYHQQLVMEDFRMCTEIDGIEVNY